MSDPTTPSADETRDTLVRRWAGIFAEPDVLDLTLGELAARIVADLTTPETRALVLALLGVDDATWHAQRSESMAAGIALGYERARQQAVALLQRYAEEHQQEGTYDGVCFAAYLIKWMES